MTQSDARSHAKKRLAVILVGGIAGVGVALGGIYGIGRLIGNPATAESCRPAAELAQKLTPLARGEVAAVAPAKMPIRVSELRFKDAGGAERTLADWRGRTVLLNLWATWCVPCRKEMPALDALQGQLGSKDFEVVAVNIDTRNLDKPKTWLNEVNVSKLAYYADPSARIFQDLKSAGRAFGMPTTLLVDKQGCEIATLAGPAEWGSEDATALVRAAIKGGP